MKHTYTKNNLIQLLYKEIDLFTRLEMEFAMDEDSRLLENYNDLKQGFDELPKVAFKPAKKAIENVLAYSKLV